MSLGYKNDSGKFTCEAKGNEKCLTYERNEDG